MEKVPCDLVLQRLLQDQPGTEAPDRLNRILLAADTSQHLIQLRRRSVTATVMNKGRSRRRAARCVCSARGSVMRADSGSRAGSSARASPAHMRLSRW
jgi:hypothetical protein